MGWERVLILVPAFVRRPRLHSPRDEAATRPAPRNEDIEDPPSRPLRRGSTFRDAHFRLSCWVIMLYSGFGTIITGTSAAKYGGGWQITSVVFYSFWTVTTSALLLFDFWRSKTRTKALLSHLGCCAVSLYFFSSLLHIASADLPPFIPNSVNLGLIGSLVFQQSSTNLEDQILGIFANIFSIPYNPRRNHISREGSPDLEMGNVENTGGLDIRSNT